MRTIYNLDKNYFLTAIRGRIFDEETNAFCSQQMTHQIVCTTEHPAFRKHHSSCGRDIATHYNEKVHKSQ
jgi:hypothetical protein